MVKASVVALGLAAGSAACVAGAIDWRSGEQSSQLAGGEAGAREWYEGNFADLPREIGSLYIHVTTRTLPWSYTDLTEAQRARVARMFERIGDAIDASRRDPCSGEWMAAAATATTAGYVIQRFYDTATGRWFLHGYDNPADGDARGMAYFWINPEPARNIVIEVPHDGVDDGTEMEGARLFTQVGARALLMNGSDRCASETETPCAAGSTGTCRGYYGLSDVAHNDTNAFFQLHEELDHRYQSNFLQLHQNVTSKQLAIVGDGTTLKDGGSALPSNVFYEALRARVTSISVDGGNAMAVKGCQRGYNQLCGTYNQEGHFTNAPDENACTGGLLAVSATHRFLHFEQATMMTGTDCDGGRCSDSVRDALLDTWGDSILNNDGGLGSTQRSPVSNSCSCGTGHR